MLRPTKQQAVFGSILHRVRGCSPAEIGLALVAGFCSLQVGLILALSLIHLTHWL